MTSKIIGNLIHNISLDTLERFFRDRNSMFAPTREKMPQYEDDMFEKAINLGNIQLDLIEHIIVCVFHVTRELTERSGKKAQYDKAKKIIRDLQADAGIFVFIGENGNFRFSLVYANYLGTKVDYSSFRRFTFFVSPELTNKTFIQRIGEGDFSSLESIKDAFSVEKVTKEFYQQISYWYFWACRNCQFPKDAEAQENGREIAVIRLITRMIFIWFMREMNLVPGKLFDIDFIEKTLESNDLNSSTYYLAILQNLFFATLNTKPEEREFRSSVRGHKGFNPDFGNQYKFRYQDYFNEPDKLPEFFGEIPFLNGGLFDCLDDKPNGIYVDGFTETKKNQPTVPDALFFSSEQDADLNAAFGTSNRSYRVEGLINILSTYNFTIDENTIDDKEVALDPELLGKVFENLLASFNPETSSTARKATGSYYTPREIVDYMVEESLKGYFKTHLSDLDTIDEKLKILFEQSNEENPFSAEETKRAVELVENVRIVDPAVGSGAFPMGALNKLVFLLSKLDKNNALWKEAQLKAADQITDPSVRLNVKESINSYFKEKDADYGRKLYLIQKCIYGVDIQQIAVEIAKLRFFIALLVDETIDKAKENWGIEPLPNLDFKIMQGNSLISEYLGIKFAVSNANVQNNENLHLFDDKKTKLIETLDQKKLAYQTESDHQQKRKLKEEIENLLIQIFESLVREQKSQYFKRLESIKRKYSVIKDSEAKEKSIIEEKQMLADKSGFDFESVEAQLRQFTSRERIKPFFPWELYFSEVFLEKDGFDIVIANPPYIGEKGHKQLFAEVKKSNLKKFYLGKMDYFYFFYHLALDLGNSQSQIAFITTNYYPTATGAVKLRKDFKQRATITKLINLNELTIFESAQGQHNMITILSKGYNPEKVAETCVTKRKGMVSPAIFSGIVNKKDDRTEYYKVSQKYLYDDMDYQIRLEGIRNLRRDPIQEILIKIRNNGLSMGEICNINQGIVTGADKLSNSHKRKYSINEPKTSGIFVLSHNEVKSKAFSLKDQEYVHKWFKNSDIDRWYTSINSSEVILYLHRTSKPSAKIISHLHKYKPLLENRREVKNNVIEWWKLQWPRSESIFQGPKIVVPQRSPTNTFAYNEIPWYASADVYYVTKKNNQISLKYLLGLLNSHLYYVWLYHRGKRKGENLELYGTPLSEIPIKLIPKNEQKLFIDQVEKILSLSYSENYAQNKEKQEQVRLLESKIDQMVYELYDLSPEEISAVEDFRNRS
jgi:adenine-specific DNA-methyltransferase